MTREEFVMWMEAHDCEPEPIGGLNVTGNAIYYVNKRNRNNYIIFTTPINDRQIPDKTIRQMCLRLLIPFPDCVVENEEIKK